MPATDFETATQAVVSDALKHIEAHYGEGSPQPKIYHNLEHTGQVMEAAARISEAALRAGRITSTEVSLIGIAAACHDTVHSGTHGADERDSALFARQAMGRHVIFTPGQIDLTTQIIMATQAKVEEGILTQRVPEGIYPAKILADADLAHFGKPYQEYQDRATLLYIEMREEGRTHGITEEAFTAMQPRLLSYHRFHTPEARKLYPHQMDNMRKVVSIIKAYKEAYAHAARLTKQAAARNARSSR